MIDFNAVRLWHRNDWSPPHISTTSQFIPEVEITGTYGETVIQELEKAKKDGKDGVLFVEHDIHISLYNWERINKLVKEVLSSSNTIPNTTPIIAIPYYLYPITTKLPDKVLAHRILDTETHGLRWLRHDDFHYLMEGPYIEFVLIDYFSMGCTFLPIRLIDKVSPKWDYPSFDTLLSASVLYNFTNIKAYAPNVLVQHLHW